jgi:ATP-dependent Clp protease ATP-binding subunit ClpB
MLSSEKQKILQVENVLKEDVIGQDEALKAISSFLHRCCRIECVVSV